MAVIDASQIERVFMNMIINAAEAMEGSGKLTIGTREIKNTNNIEISFSDTGHGISAENLKKIFDPFFTTKDVGHGTGLGLPIAKKIIEAHKGTVDFKTEDGKGTIFTITLPICKK